MYRIELRLSEQAKFFNYMAYNIDKQNNDIKTYFAKYKRGEKCKCYFYPGYGKFTWTYKEDTFNIEFYEEGNIQAMADTIDYFTRLYISHENLEKLQDFLQHAFEFVMEEEKEDKVKLYVSKCNQYGATWDTYNVTNVQNIENIFIDKNLKENVVKYIDNFIKSEEKYHKYGRNHKLNILLTGIPGSGKTSLCKALAKKYGYAIYIMNFNKNMTDSHMIDLVSDVKQNSIILYEDIDVFFTERQSHEVNVSFSCLINILDGTLSKGSGIINVITTNHPNKLDNALLRPGRIDKVVNFDYPKKEELKEAFISLIGSSDKFEDFFENIKHMKVSMAAIVDYLFRHTDDYLDKNNLTDLITQINFIQTITKEESCYKLYS